MSVFTPDEFEAMRDCAWVLGEILRDLEPSIRPGATTGEIDRVAGDLIDGYGVRAAFRGYRGYPACTTTSVNEEIIDGTPGPRTLVEGDLLKLQLGIESDGMHAYWADSYPIGKVADPVTRLVAVARQAVAAAVAQCRPETPVQALTAAIQSAVERGGLEVVKQYCGHGIGRRMHEDPQIPCHVDPGWRSSARLSPREVVAIQVMTVERGSRLETVGRALTVTSPPGGRSAHVGAIVSAGLPPMVLSGRIA